MPGPRDAAHMWLEQGRYERAESELRNALSLTPDDADLHALLSLCLTHLERESEAVPEAQAAIAAAPDLAAAHYALGLALAGLGRTREARLSANESLRLDPQNADTWALLASVDATDREWTRALANADRALALDPRHAGAHNIRAIALRSTGRRADAGEALRTTLAHDPENPLTHANLGWSALQGGRAEEATDHFREALRLDPGCDHARSGLLEAIKARNWFYRMMLAFFLWSGTLSKRGVWILLGAMLIVPRMLRQVSRQVPALQPVIFPIMMAFALFIYLTWITKPLFDVLLLLHPLGRHALDAGDRRRALLVLALLGGGLVALALSFFLAGPIWFALAIASLVFVIPVSATHEESPRRRRILTGLAAAVGLAAVLGVMGVALSNGPEISPLVILPWLVFGLGVFGISILSNVWSLSPRRD